MTEIQLIDYANGSIDAQQKEYVETHLAQCGMCREQFEQTKLIYEALGDFAVPQTNDLTGIVRQRVRAQNIWNWKHVAYNLARVAAVIVFSASLGYFAAISFAPRQQFYSISDLKGQSAISFVQPASHVALAALGETR